MKNPFFRKVIVVLAKKFPKLFASLKFRKITGHYLNWGNPSDINEKIQWLKFYSDTSLWTKLADKYQVRSFVEEKIGKDYLIPLLGVWKTPDEIDFTKLPKSFVIKTNNGAGSVIIVKDKNNINTTAIIKQINKWISIDFGALHAEPHYSLITPLIIAEELLPEDNSVSSGPIDYKIWCFDGKILGTWCCYNRNGFYADTEWHDLDWNFMPNWSVFTSHYKNGMGKIPKPHNYDEMLYIASKLSKGFPQVRVDMYNINGKIFFGEMTFTCAGGFINFYSKEILQKMGEMTILPKERR